MQELKDPERGRGCGEAGRPGWQPRTQSSPAELEAGTEAAGEAAAQEHGGQEVALNIQASLSEIIHLRQIVIDKDIYFSGEQAACRICSREI